MKIKITVVDSKELQQLRLGGLVGKTGEVVQECKTGKWIKFAEQYLGEEEWFIPTTSLKN